jgi:hypothetical protein
MTSWRTVALAAAVTLAAAPAALADEAFNQSVKSHPLALQSATGQHAVVINRAGPARSSRLLMSVRGFRGSEHLRATKGTSMYSDSGS